MSEGRRATARGTAAGGAAAVRSAGATTPRRTLLVLGVVIVVVALIATVGLVWERRERTIVSAGQEMRRLSTVLAGEVARTIQGVDVMLRTSAEAYLALAQTEASSPASVHVMLRERAAALSDVVRIHSIVGPDGRLLYDSLTDRAPTLWLGAHDFFPVQRDLPAQGLHISPPSRLANYGDWVLILSRRLEHRDGSFAGVIVAVVNAAHFERLFGSLDLGPGTAVSLVHHDGGLIARAPPQPEAIGNIDREIDPRPLLKQGAREAVIGSAEDAGPAPPMLAVRALPDLPLAVVVSGRPADLLAGWREETSWVAGAVLLALVAVLILLALLARQIRRHEHIAEALADSQRWLDRAQAAANIGSWVSRLTGRDDWSPETFRVLGVDPAAFVPSVASFETLVHPADFAGYREAARQAIKLGIPYNHVHRIVRPDGTVRWIHSQADVIRNADGRTVQMIGTVQDITDRKIAEDALRLSEARLRDYAETASDWYWETGPDDRFTYLSSRIKSFGMDSAVRLGKTRRELAADGGDDPDKWRDLEAITRRHEPFRDFVYKMALPGERESYVSVSGKPVFDSDGRFLGYRGTARDVTAFMQAEERLREAKTTAETASAAKTSFLANMSHELRTPLNAIIGFAEALSAGYFGALNTKQTEYVRDIRESGNHLLLLINDLLDVAKIEAGKFELQPEPLDLVHEVQACLRLVMPRAVEGNVSLEPQLPAGLPPFRADRRALKQVVLNLLSNAVKFTLPGGRVTVSVRYDPADGAQISVADTGIGIASSDLPKVVMPFGSLSRNATLSRRREGTGLGLPLSKSLVEMHGGRLEIVSEVGHGTIATVRLPAEPPARGTAIPGSTSTAVQR
jgi:PAS domain S-box-containing protein